LFQKKIRHDRLLFPVCLEEVTSNTTPILFSVLYRHLLILTTCKEVDRYADVHLVLRRIGQTFEPNLYQREYTQLKLQTGQRRVVGGDWKPTLTCQRRADECGCPLEQQ
jgi:hypothetical protein